MNTNTPAQEVDRRLDAIANDPDLIYGIKGIGEVLGLNVRQTHYHLTMKRIPAARKIGGLWIASRRELLRPFVSYPVAAE